MATLKDIDNYLNEYKQPTKLGKLVLDAITKELYSKRPDSYSKKLSALWGEAIHKGDIILGATTLYKWLDLTEFKDSEALQTLRDTNLIRLLSSAESPDLKYKTLATWITYSPGKKLRDLLCAISDPTVYLLKYNKWQPTKTKLNRIYPPDERTQIKLIITTILSNTTCLTDKSLGIPKYINDIIQKLNLSAIPEIEVVQLLAISPHLSKRATTKIGKYCFSSSYPSVLTTAQALGVVNNPDYWVQSLPSQQIKLSTSSEDLPELT